VAIDIAVVKAWIVFSAFLSVVGFLFGYRFIAARLDGALFGVIVIKVVEFIYLEALLSIIATVV